MVRDVGMSSVTKRMIRQTLCDFFGFNFFVCVWNRGRLRAKERRRQSITNIKIESRSIKLYDHQTKTWAILISALSS